MKTRFLQSKILFVAMTGFFMMFTQLAQSGEFVVLNRTYTYTYPEPSNGGAFNCNVRNFSSMPSNWLSPDDYWRGNFYAHIELLSAPGNEVVGFQFGIYQYYLYNGQDYYETCSFARAKLQGAGDVTEINYGSPINWWQHGNGGVDFTKPNEFEEAGLAIWSEMPGHIGIICPTASGGDDIANAVRSYFEPCTIRVIVVAVSAGSSFSGWDHYTGGCIPAKQATPTYGIDYVNHTTDKVVPSTDEYSYSSNMSGAVSGTGAKLALTLGQDVYFRTKASGECFLASDIQHLDVPDTWTCTPVKQATPTYGIDYGNHSTDKVVPSTDEYSYASDMSGAVSGTGIKLILAANQDVYFRTKASGECFLASDIQYLDVPLSWGGCTPVKKPTPTYAIDYTNEMTDKVVPSTDEYAYYSNMSYAVSGTGVKLTIVPGQTVYFRTKGVDACNLASDVQHLYMPTRPAQPSSYTIDFINEKTTESVPSTIEYSTSASFTSSATGTGVPATVTPGEDLYFRVKATSSSLCSDAIHLVIPSRPAAPSSFTVDFVNEKTSQVIPSGMEYSTSATFSSSTGGTGSMVSLTPGQDLYIRYKASASVFASAAFVLDVPARPAAPVATIDYDQETTVETFSSTIEYSTSVSMSGAVNGSGATLALTPGTDLYLRQKATASSFISGITHLAVPARPSAPSITSDYASESTSAIPSTMAWSTYSSGTSAVSGVNAPVPLTPGIDLYIWVKATASSFASAMQTLNVPDRPAAPVVTIDYANEETAEAIPSTIEYSLNAAMTSPVSGINTVLALTPGSGLYLRYKATASTFASALLHLAVPARPAAPAYTIDYASVQTTENVPSEEEYATHSDMTGATSGAGVKVDLSPGVTVYFRIKSTASSFASAPYELIVPARPEILAEVGDTLESDFFLATLDFHSTSTDGFGLSDIETVNAQLTDMGELTVKVTPEATGLVSMKIVANALDAGNFASVTRSTYYKKNVSAMRNILSAESSLRVYPAPVRDILKVETIRNLSLPLEIRLLDCNGMVALQQEMFSPLTTIDMSEYPAGLYILLAIDADGNALTCKVIKQ